MNFTGPPRDDAGRFKEKPEVGVANRLTHVLREALGHDGSTEPPPDMDDLNARIEAQAASPLATVADQMIEEIGKAETVADLVPIFDAATEQDAAGLLLESGMAKHAPGQLVADCLDLCVTESKDWNPRDHPRDKLGRFASIGAIVSLLDAEGGGGGSGQVIGTGENGHIRVRKADGSVVDVAAKDTEVTQAAPGDVPGAPEALADTSVGQAGKPGSFGDDKVPVGVARNVKPGSFDGDDFGDLPDDPKELQKALRARAKDEPDKAKKQALMAAAAAVTAPDVDHHANGSKYGEGDEDFAFEPAIDQMDKLAGKLDDAGKGDLAAKLRDYVDGYRGQPKGHSKPKAEGKQPADAATGATARFGDELLKRMDEGGFTFSTFSENFRNTGFAVAVPGKGKSFEPGTLTKDELRSYIRANWDDLAANPSLHLGGWQEDDGTAWLDLSEVYDDKDKAYEAGMERGELAIADIGAFANGDDGTIEIDYADAKPLSGPALERYNERIESERQRGEPSGAGGDGEAAAGADTSEGRGDRGRVRGADGGSTGSSGSAKPKVESDWGKPYGGDGPAYNTPDGPVWMRRKGQAVRFFDTDGNQVGPEQRNVAPASAYAQEQGWTSPSLEAAGITPLLGEGMGDQPTVEVPGSVAESFTKIKVPGRTAPPAMGTVDDPIDVQGDLDKAVELLADGKHVRLNQVDEVATLVDKLRERVAEAAAKGEKAEPIDLCQVSVPGTNLFCTDHKGIPRAQMPQLSGTPVEGSPAAAKAGPDGRANIEPEYREALAARGIDITPTRVPASHLRATQNQLDGIKVSMIAKAMDEGKVEEAPIFVTRDGYVIDGHHRWAANLSRDTDDNSLGDVDMPVNMLDMDIGAAIDFANAFAAEMGIKSQGLADRDNAPKEEPLGADELRARLEAATSESLRESLQAQLDALEGKGFELKRLFSVASVQFNPRDHPRDHRGRFINTPDVTLPDGSIGRAISAANDNTITVAKPGGDIVAVAPEDLADNTVEPSVADVARNAAQRAVDALFRQPLATVASVNADVADGPRGLVEAPAGPDRGEADTVGAPTAPPPGALPAPTTPDQGTADTLDVDDGPQRPPIIDIAGEPITRRHSLWWHLVPDGEDGWTLSEERRALHERIVAEALADVPESTDPTFYMLGGGPASGKSTMLRDPALADVPDDEGMKDGEKSAVVVNPDNVKAVLPEYQDMVAGGQSREAAPFVHEESSIVSKRIQAQALAAKRDVLLDGTGDSSEKKLMRKITQARKAGYTVKGYYATIPTDEAWARAEKRRMETGRVVPEPVLRGIHASVSSVFPKVYDDFDEVTLFDTRSWNGARVIAVGKGQTLTITDPEQYEAFLAKADEVN